MKKSLSVISSLLFAALCLGFAFNAYAQDVTALNDANTVISFSEQNYVYDGTPKKPTVSVYYNGVLLSENVDYSLKFSDFVSAGTVKVTVTGMNSYNGSVTKEYTIKPITFNSKNLSVTFDKTSLVYYNSAKAEFPISEVLTDYIIKNTTTHLKKYFRTHFFITIQASFINFTAIS